MLKFVRAAAIATLTLLPAAAMAADEKAQNLLFDSRQLDLIGKGSEVTYKFERKSSSETLTGKNVADEIRLAVENVNAKGERNVVFKIFTGSEARDPQHFPELTINPLFIWYLDRAVSNFNYLAGGAQMYLKHRIREAFREGAQVEQVKATYNGETIDAHKVTIYPFTNDASASKMQGYQHSSFIATVSNQVPGYFVELQSNFVSNQAAAPKLEEQIKLVGIGEAK